MFGSLLGLSALGCGATTGGATAGGDTSVRDGFEASYCTNNEPNLVVGINPAQAVDYVALRATAPWAGGDQVVQENGTACVAQSTQCLAALNAPVAGGILVSLGQAGAIHHHLVTTRGDEVMVLLTVDEVKTFLGTIDTPNEAALGASARRSCTARGRTHAGARPLRPALSRGRALGRHAL